MSEVETQFIVQLPNGRKSKPTTREAIQKMYAAGKISPPADVVCPGKSFCVPIDDFVSDSGLLNRMLGELPDSPKSDGLNPIIEPASVFVPRSAGLADSERLPELPTLTFPAGKGGSRHRQIQSTANVGNSFAGFSKQVAAIALGITLAVSLCVGGCVVLTSGVAFVGVMASGWPTPTAIPEDKIAVLKKFFRDREPEFDPEFPEEVNPTDYRFTHWWEGSRVPSGQFGYPVPGYSLAADALVRVERIGADGSVMGVDHVFLNFPKKGEMFSPWQIMRSSDIPEQYR